MARGDGRQQRAKVAIRPRTKTDLFGRLKRQQADLKEKEDLLGRFEISQKLLEQAVAWTDDIYVRSDMLDHLSFFSSNYKIENFSAYEGEINLLEKLTKDLSSTDFASTATALADKLKGVDVISHSYTGRAILEHDVNHIQEINQQVKDSLLGPMTKERDQLRAEVDERRGAVESLRYKIGSEALAASLGQAPVVGEAVRDLALVAADPTQRSEMELLFGGGRVGEAGKLLAQAVAVAPESQATTDGQQLASELIELGRRLPWRQEMGESERERAALAAWQLARLAGLDQRDDDVRSAAGLLFGPRRERQQALSEPQSKAEALRYLSEIGLLDKEEQRGTETTE